MSRLTFVALFVLAFTTQARAGGIGFASCGTIVEGVECLLFQADGGGLYVVAGLGGAGKGDRVWVSGTLDPTCITTCQQGNGCIFNATVAPCVETCGYIDDGPFGLRFVADGGGRFVLDNFGDFAVGDRVYVVGANESKLCDTPDDAGCIRFNTIMPCFAECVELTGVTQGCVIFQTDEGEIVGVENTAGMFPPGRVYVTGPVVTPALFCFPFPGQGVFDNLIGPCFEACGHLFEAGEGNCLRLLTDDGTVYRLDNTGPFADGDRVRVEGIAEILCGPPCGTFQCVRYNTIAWAQADLDCDENVGFADLTRVLADWGPCPGGPCPSDLDGNGGVGFSDLSIVLALWDA